MAKLIEKKPRVRKISVKKRESDVPVRECVICGNSKEEDLAYYYNDGTDKLKRVDHCKGLSTCAGLVSTFLSSSGKGK